MQQHALSRPLSHESHSLSALAIIAMLVLTLIQPLALTYRTVGMPSSVPATSEAPSLAAQLQALFPTLEGDLAARAEFRPATRMADGQTIEGFAPSADLTPPAALQPAEQQAWLAMTRRAAPDGASALKLFFPSRYSDPFVVEANRMQITLRALDAEAASVQIEDGTLAYRDLYPATDSLHLAGNGQSKEFLLLHSPAAPTRYRYLLDAGPGAMVTLEAGAVRIAAVAGTY
jgi:hypothetical protein